MPCYVVRYGPVQKRRKGKLLIQVRGFGYEDDGSLRENHRVILRPDRIRLLL